MHCDCFPKCPVNKIVYFVFFLIFHFALLYIHFTAVLQSNTGKRQINMDKHAKKPREKHWTDARIANALETLTKRIGGVCTTIRCGQREDTELLWGRWLLLPRLPVCLPLPTCTVFGTCTARAHIHARPKIRTKHARSLRCECIRAACLYTIQVSTRTKSTRIQYSSQIA